MFKHTSFFSVAEFTMSNPTLPPKVLGFQYIGEHMGFPRRPFREKGAPISTMLSPNMVPGLVLSSIKPG